MSRRFASAKAPIKLSTVQSEQAVPAKARGRAVRQRNSKGFCGTEKPPGALFYFPFFGGPRFMKKTGYELIKKVSWWSIAVNLFLSAFKMIAGILARSSAMVTDAVHSASDVLTTFVVLIGVKLSKKEADAEHPYGHERLESVAGMILAIFLALTGIGIGYSGIMKVISGIEGTLAVPGVLALVAAIVSIVIKEAMFWITRNAAKKTKSTALMADAWHHRSDALSSVGSFIGIGGAMLGLPIMDPIASLVICLFILKAAFDVARDATNRMVDRSCDEATQSKMKETISAVNGVKSIDILKTRIFGNRIYLDVEIGCDGTIPLMKSHAIAECVHDRIEETFPDVKHCNVHVNPYLEKKE